MSSGYRYIKRLMDLALALVLLIILLPFFIVIIIVLTCVQGQPFFTQLRPGKDGRLFRLIKFKTMNDRKDASGTLLPDNVRLTATGKFIRKTSLDEIPQLLNVIKGDMSLVGPRPLLTEYLPLYNKFQARRHEVKPGITGWAQVNGRNAISWKQKFEYDVWYVDNATFLLDLKIAWLTILRVMQSKDINSATSATMEKFTGN